MARARGRFEIEFADHGIPSIKATIEFRTVHKPVSLLGVSDDRNETDCLAAV